MAIFFSTETRIHGPWLIDDSSLKQLDQLLKEEYSRLETRRNGLIESYAQKQLDSFQKNYPDHSKKLSETDKLYKEFMKKAPYSYLRNNRSITLTLKNGNVYKTEDLSTALRDNCLLDETITGLLVEIESSDIRVKLEIENRFNELTLNVTPDTIPEARETYAVLKQWVAKNSPPFWQQKWGEISGFIWIFFIFVIMFGLMSLSFFSESVTANAKKEAIKLLDIGISENNLSLAVTYLLILATHYDPNSTGFIIPSWFKILIGSSFLLCVILSFRPKVILGIGKGTNLITSWRIWHKIVGITIPGLIFGSFIWPNIVNWITQIFH